MWVFSLHSGEGLVLYKNKDLNLNSRRVVCLVILFWSRNRGRMTSSRRPECYLRLGFPARLVCKSRKSHTKKPELTWTGSVWHTFCLRQNVTFQSVFQMSLRIFHAAQRSWSTTLELRADPARPWQGVKRQNSRTSRNSVKQRRLHFQANWYSQLELLQSLGMFGIHKGINILKEKIQISHEKPCIFKVSTIIVTSFLNRENKSKFHCEVSFLSASLLPGPPRVRSTHVRQGTPMSGAHSVRCLPGAPWVKIEDVTKDILSSLVKKWWNNHKWNTNERTSGVGTFGIWILRYSVLLGSVPLLVFPCNLDDTNVQVVRDKFWRTSL